MDGWLGAGMRRFHLARQPGRGEAVAGERDAEGLPRDRRHQGGDREAVPQDRLLRRHTRGCSEGCHSYGTDADYSIFFLCDLDRSCRA